MTANILLVHLPTNDLLLQLRALLVEIERFDADRRSVWIYALYDLLYFREGAA